MQGLTAIAVKQAKQEGKSYKMTDGRGLYLLVKPEGKYWRYNYRFLGKQKTLALGVYPGVSLADARQAHEGARAQLSEGVDPAESRREEKLKRMLAAEETFDAIAREWFVTRIADKSESHKSRTLGILEKDLFPKIGRRPIANITPTELLAVLRTIESRSVDMAHRARQTAGQVFRYAVATDRAQRDVARDLAGARRTKVIQHHAAITDPDEIGKLMIAIHGYSGSPVIKAALAFSALVFQRPGEIRHMRWEEVNWDDSCWEIPARKRKLPWEHIVPLSGQSMRLLEALYERTGKSVYVFPSARGRRRPLSENGVRTALRSMGYGNESMTPHGFRAMARIILDEVLGFRVDWIERQLAHAVKDPNGRAYDPTANLEGRRQMMQGWADYLDHLRDVSLGLVHYRVRPKC